PSWQSGSTLLPHRFVPFDIYTMRLTLPESYQVSNHLVHVLDEVLALQDEPLLFAINHCYASSNPVKATEQTARLTKDDFYEATLLQVNGLFNPSQLSKEVTIFKENAPTHVYVTFSAIAICGKICP